MSFSDRILRHHQGEMCALQSMVLINLFDDFGGLHLYVQSLQQELQRHCVIGLN